MTNHDIEYKINSFSEAAYIYKLNLMLFKSMVFMAIYLVNFQINIIIENRDTFNDCKYVVKELDKLRKDYVKISSRDFKNFRGKSYFKDYAN